MKRLFSLFACIAVLLGPLSAVPAHAFFKRAGTPPTYLFCSQGALASFYAPTTNAPIGDGCLTAPQPGVDGSTGGFRITNCWVGSGAGAMNSYNGTTTDYGAANSSPLTVSTPWHDPGCAYPVGAKTPIAQLKDPAPGGTPTSAIADCVYSATGNFAGFPLLTCNPTLAHYPSGIFTISGYDFGTQANHPCLAIEFPSAPGAGITEVDIINNHFKNDNGSCSTYIFNPVMIHQNVGYLNNNIITKIYSNTFDGNGFVWRNNQGSCTLKSNSCNVIESIALEGAADLRYNLFTNFIGRTTSTVTGTNQNLTMMYNMFLGGDVSGPEHSEFTQTFTQGTPNGDGIYAYNDFLKTTGSTDTWDALVLTTYTGTYPNGAWNHLVVDHNIIIPGSSGSSTGGSLTGCSIADGTSTLVCTGATGGKVGTGRNSSTNACNGAVTYMLDSLISATGVKGTDWGDAGPGGGQWVSNGGSTWSLDANPPGDVFTVVGGIDNGSGGAGNTLTVTGAAAYNLDPLSNGTFRLNNADAKFTQTSTNNFVNGDTVQVGNNTYTFDTAIPTVAGHVLIGNAALGGFTKSAANLVLAINGSGQPNAQAILSMSTNFSNGDTLVIGNNTFHTVTSLGVTAGNVLIGASNSATITNLNTALNGTCSTTCVTPTNTPNVTGANNGGGKGTFTAITAGSGGNSLVSTYTGGGTGSFTTGSTFINGVGYVAPGTTPNISASSGTTTITFNALVNGPSGNAYASVYTASGTAAGTFPAATFLDGINSVAITAFVGGSTGGNGQYTVGGSAQYVPPGSTLSYSLYPYYAGQWSVNGTQTCGGTQTFQHSVQPAVTSFMGYYIFNGSAITNNLTDDNVVNTTNWTPWYMQVTIAAPPACVANDMVGADPSNPTFTIFGTQNFDMSHLVTGGVNRWNNSFDANGCGL